MSELVAMKMEELTLFGVDLYAYAMSNEELIDTIEVGMELGWVALDFADHFAWLTTLTREA